MLRLHLSQLFDDPNLRARAHALAARTFELVSFLTDVLRMEQLRARYCCGPVTYHDSCSGLRELGIKRQPRQLLRAMGVEIVEMADSETCCGFGGTFCVKYPEISVRMASDKVRGSLPAGTWSVLAGDLGCLLNLAGRFTREGHNIKVRHVAEVLAGMAHVVPPIGQGSS
jgi:L-lactate dehydrogenase complex protein LldE